MAPGTTYMRCNRTYLDNLTKDVTGSSSRRRRTASLEFSLKGLSEFTFFSFAKRKEKDKRRRERKSKSFAIKHEIESTFEQ